MGDGLVRVADIHEQTWAEHARATRCTGASPASRWRTPRSWRRSCPRSRRRTTCARRSGRWRTSSRRTCRGRTGGSSSRGTRSACGRGTPTRAAAATSAPLQTKELRPRLRVRHRQIEHRGVVHVKPRRVTWRNLELDQPYRPVIEQLSMMRLLIHRRNRVLTLTSRVRRLPDTGLSVEHRGGGERTTGDTGKRR